MAETETKINEKPRRETPWPGGPRAAESAPAKLNADGQDYFAGSDLAESDPNWTGLWPGENVSAPFLQPEAEPALAPELTQMPPRAWPPVHVLEEEPLVVTPYTPEPVEEIARRSGLAWSAGIVFFCSVVFMLFLGWGADLLFGSSPFGLVAGIVIGSSIGFIQFFRLSSQMYRPSNRRPEIKSLLSQHDDEDDSGRF